MTHDISALSAPFQLLFLTLLANVLCAANAPRFAFTFAAGNFGGTSVAVDSSGNTYLAGSVVGSPFAATPGAYQSLNAGGTCYGSGIGSVPQPIPCRNTFVIKLDPSGAVAFATYFGGSANADATAIAVDSHGDVYVAGTVEADPANPLSFPVTPGAAFPLTSIQGTAGNVAYLAKLNALGTQLEYSTLIPGIFYPSIAVDAAGNAFFTAQWSPDFGSFPATGGAYQTAPGNSVSATVIGKLNPSGSALMYGTYLSGTMGYSYGQGIAVDAAGNVLTGGTTSASDFPATAGQFSTSDGDASGGYRNLYLAKLSPDGGNLIYATLLGPGQGGMVLGPSGDIYFACWSTAFPVTSGGFGLPGGTGNYLVHVSPDGSSVLNAIYLPFALNGLDVDAAGNAYIVGSGSAQTTAGAFQPSPSDNQTNQLVVAKITPDGQVAGATYVGVSGNPSIAAERDGSVIVAGAVASGDPGAGAFLAANFFPAITLENAASYVANTAVPGEIATIRGYGIGPATGVASSPAAGLGGVQVYFDNFPAPLIYAQAGQINAQVPWEIAGQAATQMRILYNGAEAGAAVVPVGAALPGLFYIENSDGSFNSPSNPARAGDYVAIYGTGAGVMSPPGVTGNSWPLAPLSSLTQSVTATVGGEAARVLYSGSAPTLESGFFQIGVQLPADLTAAAHFLYVTIGGVTGAPAAISIQ